MKKQRVIIFLLFFSFLLLNGCNIDPGTEDPNRPIVAFTSPESGKVVDDNYVVEGLAMDDTGIVSVFVRNQQMNWIPAILDEGYWSADMTFTNIDMVSNEVYAVDSEGNYSLTNQLVLQKASLTIDTPIIGNMFFHPAIIFSGKAAIGAPHHITNVKASLNHGSYIDCEGTNEWSVELRLESGSNSMKVAFFTDSGLSVTNDQGSCWFVPQIIYMSFQGADTNDGYTENRPKLSLQDCIDAAYRANVFDIRIRNGSYYPASEILLTNHFVKISGGWNSNFTLCQGISYFDGSDDNTIMSIENASNLVISNLIFLNGSNDNYDHSAAGLRISNSHVVLLSNFSCVSNAGTGLFIKQSTFITNSGEYSYNSGNGLTIENCSFNHLSGSMSFNNRYGIYSGGSYNNNDLNVYCSSNSSFGIFIGGDFISNSITVTVCSNGANAMEFLNFTFYNTMNLNIFDNTGCSFGAIYGENFIFNTINANVYNNDFDGGIYLLNSYSNEIDCVISNNDSGGMYGGGLTLEGGGYNTINGLICDNIAFDAGGICLLDSDNNVINSIISNNSSPNCGGIYLFGDSNLINGLISYNSNYGIYIDTNFSFGNIYTNFGLGNVPANAYTN